MIVRRCGQDRAAGHGPHLPPGIHVPWAHPYLCLHKCIQLMECLSKYLRPAFYLCFVEKGRIWFGGFENKAGRLDPSLLPRLMEAYNTDLSCSSAV